jgi:hypothetical protein
MGFYSYYIPFLLVIKILLTNSKLYKFDRLLLFFISYNAVIVFIEQFYLFGKIENFNPIYNIQTILDFYVLYLLLKSIIVEIKSSLNLFFKITSFLFIILFVLDTFFIRDLSTNNYFETIIAKFLIIILSFYTSYLIEFKENYNKGRKIFVHTILIYSFTTFSISLFEEYYRSKENDQLFVTWIVLFLLTILYNLGLTISLWKLKR